MKNWGMLNPVPLLLWLNNINTLISTFKGRRDGTECLELGFIDHLKPNWIGVGFVFLGIFYH
jgi:hypothetical protein